MTLAYSPYRMSPATSSHSQERGAELVDREGRALPLSNVRLSVTAGGGIARAVLEQTFTNDTPDTLHLTYRMPLPADGAVSGYKFELGARTIEGKVEPKKQARAHFEQAIVEGRTAAILDQETDDIFTQEIGNVPAGARIIASITVDMKLAWLPEGEWEMRFPTVIGPRYVSESQTQKVRESVAVDTVDAKVSDIAVEIRVRDAITRPASSPSHRIRGERVIEAEGTLDRDLVVRWGVAEPEVGLSVMGGGKHALLTIVPPVHPKDVTPRDLVILLDTSGSMGGTPLDSAKKILRALIGSLGESDRLELIEFSNAPRRWKNGAVFASESEKAGAIKWMEKLEATGSTEMASAVKTALTALRPTAQRQVVLVTDGYIGGEEQILALLHDSLPPLCRFHVVGVGSAPNRTLSMSLARAGRGVEVLAAPGEDLERPVKRLLDRTVAPVLTELSVEGAAVLETAPRAVPDVFAGSPVVVALQIGRGAIVVNGMLGGKKWSRTIAAPTEEEMPQIKALYARERVLDLEILNTMNRDAESTDRTIESIGVEYQIATRLTSWVAIDEEKSVDPTKPSNRVSIPQELPHGTSMASFGLGGVDGGMLMAAPMSYSQTMTGSIGRVPFPMSAPAPARAMRIPPPAAAGGAPPPPRGMPARGGFGAPPPAPQQPAPAAPKGAAREEDDEVRSMARAPLADRDEGASAPEPMPQAIEAKKRAPETPPMQAQVSLGSVEPARMSPPKTGTGLGLWPRRLIALAVLLFVLFGLALLVWFLTR